MPALISTAEALAFLRLEGDAVDAGLMLMIEAASEIVLEHIKKTEEEWIGDTPPAAIRMATVIALVQLDQNRSKPEVIGAIAPILRPFRDPTLA